MKTDSDIQRDVMDELRFDPSVRAEDIGVSVKDGVVTLGGFVPTFAEKYTAEKAAFRVAGVRAVAEEIEVKLPNDYRRNDQELAEAAANALAWHAGIPETVNVTVEDGDVILSGEVDWEFQRRSALNATRYLIGVKSVKNRIELKNRPQPENVKHMIEKALVRNAEEDAKKINVKTEGSKVVLSGIVRSRAELDDAKWAAWSAPGVTSVENHLKVS